MFNTKIAILALSAVTAAATASKTESFREQNRTVRPTVAIPVQVVGDSVTLKPAYSPAMQCKVIELGSDIDVINACAVKRVGWLKL